MDATPGLPAAGRGLRATRTAGAWRAGNAAAAVLAGLPTLRGALRLLSATRRRGPVAGKLFRLGKKESTRSVATLPAQGASPLPPLCLRKGLGKGREHVAPDPFTVRPAVPAAPLQVYLQAGCLGRIAPTLAVRCAAFLSARAEAAAQSTRLGGSAPLEGKVSQCLISGASGGPG